MYYLFLIANQYCNVAAQDTCKSILQCCCNIATIFCLLGQISIRN